MLHPQSKERLEASPLTGKALAELMENISNGEEQPESHHFAVHYVQEGDTYEVGQYVPEIHIVLRRVMPDDVQPDPR